MTRFFVGLEELPRGSDTSRNQQQQEATPTLELKRQRERREILEHSKSWLEKRGQPTGAVATEEHIFYYGHGKGQQGTINTDFSHHWSSDPHQCLSSADPNWKPEGKEAQMVQFVEVSHQHTEERWTMDFFFFLAALGLRCCTRAFSSCSEQRLLFVAVRGLLTAVDSLVVKHGLQAHRLQQLWRMGFSSCVMRASVVVPHGLQSSGSVVVVHRLSCSVACGILPDQGSNPCPLHWQVDSQPLRHQGNPTMD